MTFITVTGIRRHGVKITPTQYRLNTDCILMYCISTIGWSDAHTEISLLGGETLLVTETVEWLDERLA